MLVLSRKVGESIQIGAGIFLQISRIAGNRVTVAIEAPKDVSIKRSELPDISKASVNAARNAFQQNAEQQAQRDKEAS